MTGDVVVRTGRGAVRGTVAGGVAAFRGIPYGAPPEGALRFAAPRPAEPWDGVRDATAFGTAAPQLPPAPGAPAVWSPGDGLDCLSVNVWTPDPGGPGLPVMVWLHGGRWTHGSPSMPQFDGSVLAGAGVVVVTVGYRVGFEGFGHLPGAPDNRGLLDQIAALDWVAENIAGFGGDPGAVTVFGQSSGAVSAILLMGAARAEGLFRRVIAQSPPAGQLEPAEAYRVTRVLAGAAGVEPTREGFASLPAEAILAVGEASGVQGSPFAPVTDGELVTGPYWDSAPRPEVDLVCGFTREEYLGIAPVPPDPDPGAAAAAFGLDPAPYLASGPGWFVAMASDALVRIPALRAADAHASAGGRTWVYDFAWRGPAGAAHGVDVPVVFGTEATRYAARLLGSPPPPEYPAFAGRVRRAWTSFAACGDPGWPRYDSAGRTARVWAADPRDERVPPVAGGDLGSARR
ncbi:carboxylesterase/lipase family protein [Bailinhaonella thermotolerans]|uniref:Carboxylic ester hydrolase n=1 Tax=Bailinhaonella thermotolerans TaxID=1070861 RepID=A0A3A4AY66_9ACTN|nr:carboxylesterase family protein [Bailinhaonella thermotolerans]RJL30783.1 carboxylesterase/lipase family protein [Bailinhaonella thermotolerans]